MPSKPLIGLTTFRKDSGRSYHYLAVTEAYVTAIRNAGALPVLIPLGLPESDLDDLRERLDGLVLTGGGDIDPDRFQGEPHPTVHEIDPDRDRVELHLAREVVARQQPFLGICRGLQVLNVALGGDLYTHITAQHPAKMRHDYWPDFPRDMIAHPVKITEGTRLADILQTPMPGVNSLHHQGIRQLARGLKPSALAPDGLIEAVEVDDHPFGLAVQWHPEWLMGEHAMPELFAAFIDAAAHGRR